MAEVRLNEETGLFESVVGDQSADQVVMPSEAAEILEEEQEHVENQEDMVDDLGAAALPDQEEASAGANIYTTDNSVSLMSAAASSTSFTPQAWQLNLASGRSFGQHYLIYADRVYYSGSSSYWRYYLVLGDDISYENDTYAFSDCDLYSYYTYDGVVHYDRETASGALSGASQVVYSDLYFDYVGVDPAARAAPYITYVLLFMIILFLIVRGKLNV